LFLKWAVGVAAIVKVALSSSTSKSLCESTIKLKPFLRFIARERLLGISELRVLVQLSLRDVRLLSFNSTLPSAKEREETFPGAFLL
jgi:hypothetical protein